MMRSRWLAELALGARLALTGGREGWLRTGLTVIGVGLGVGLLLLAASVPTLLQARAERTVQRNLPWDYLERPADDTLLVRAHDLDFRGGTIRGVMLRAEGPAAPTPPGVAALPGPDELVVSPALADLLASPDGALLAPRLDYPVVGTIGDEGLRGPAELAFYLGTDELDPEGTHRIDHFGRATFGEPLHPFLVLLTIIGFIVLLLPVAMFVAVAARFGGEQRDRRLAALRLVGADARMTRRIAAGEALLGAALGVLAGIALFLIGREFVEPITLWDINAFTADVRPAPAFAALTVVAVPALAVTVTLFALRGLVIEPLGVVRRAGGARRRLWWRLILPVAGLALLYPVADDGFLASGPTDQTQVGAGVVLLLIGVAALLPWLVDAVVRRLPGGGVSWQLATRRLQLSGGSAGRMVNGIAVAAAGGIALQMLFTGVQGDFVRHTGADPDQPRAVAAVEAGSLTSDAVAARFRETPGVRAAAGVSIVLADPGTLVIGECAALAAMADIGECRDGDVFVVSDGSGGPVARPGGVITVPEDGATWTVPDSAPVIPARDPIGLFYTGVLATPAAVAGLSLRPSTVFAYLQLDPAVPDAVEHVRNTTAAIDRTGSVIAEEAVIVDHHFDGIRRALLVGVTATLLLIGLSLLVGTLEQLWERRRLLAVLVAFGTRRTTLGWSVLWQTTVPMALGLAVATVAGAGLGGVLLVMVGSPLSIAWRDLALISGAGAAVVLLVTVLSLPALWRLMRPDGLRTE